MRQDRDPTEQRLIELDHRIAARIRSNPGMIAEAKARLVDVMTREAPDVDPVLGEWLDILLMLEPAGIADFLESTTPRARRLRISSPLRWMLR